ncbi:MAG: pantoate--beta-alanine ligase [Candidatus Dormibacteraeota bacterium]|nr:pantoate--beta-alanine ligase [Candidatus Dormibacteraeota bacterium]
MPEGPAAAAGAQPVVVGDPAQLRAITHTWRCQGARIGLVPTMGAIHEGHLSLVAAARGQCQKVIVSTFVNPLQFGPGEDFTRYPRRPDQDRELLRRAGVDAIYAPSQDSLYPPSFATKVTVDMEGLSRFEGAARPGHFQGVATVVAKLFGAVGPCLAFFGEKDAQQVALVRRLAADLDQRVELHECPTVREADGLAMSSRNEYLGEEARRSAVGLSGWLRLAQQLFRGGERRATAYRKLAEATVARDPGVTLEYADVVDPSDFSAIDTVDQGSRLLIAARVGGVRLIDTALLGSASLD